MLNYQSSGDVFEAVVAWSSIRALETRYDFVEEAANELMQEFIRAMVSENQTQLDKLHLLN
jgi:hypothetical protein